MGFAMLQKHRSAPPAEPVVEPEVVVKEGKSLVVEEVKAPVAEPKKTRNKKEE